MREYRGFSQDEVARHVGLSRSAISLIESGSRQVRALELRRLATMYETTMEYLAGSDRVERENESYQLVARAAADLSEKDRVEVLRFVQFLQSREDDDESA